MLCASKNPKNIYMYPATFTDRRSIIVIVEAIGAVVGVIVGAGGVHSRPIRNIVVVVPLHCPLA